MSSVLYCAHQLPEDLGTCSQEMLNFRPTEITSGASA